MLLAVWEYCCVAWTCLFFFLVVYVALRLPTLNHVGVSCVECVVVFPFAKNQNAVYENVDVFIEKCGLVLVFML